MAKEETAGQEKMTYEKLEEAFNAFKAHNEYLSRQNHQLIQKVNELADVAMFRRIDYLFKVVELSDKFPSSFVECRKEELVDILTPPERPSLNPDEGNESKQE